MNHGQTFANVPPQAWLPFLLLAAALIGAYLRTAADHADEDEVTS